MSESLSLWDILLLKDEITVEQWVIYSYIIPTAIVLIIIVIVGIRYYWSDVKYVVSKLFRRCKR